MVNTEKEIVTLWCHAAVAEVIGEWGNSKWSSLGLVKVLAVIYGKCMIDFSNIVEAFPGCVGIFWIGVGVSRDFDEMHVTFK